MLGRIFKVINFRRTDEPVSTKLAPPPQPVTTLSEASIEAASREDNSHGTGCDSQLTHRESPTLDAIVASRHVSGFDSRLVDIALTHQLKSRNINLSTMSINAIGFTPGVVGSLRRGNIHTVEQLSNCAKTDLFSLPSIGITRLRQIQEDLNSFLKSLLAEEHQELTRQEDLRQHLVELTSRLSDILGGQIPLSPACLPPQVGRDLAVVLGKEPKSFAELEQSVQELKIDIYYGIGNADTGRYLALERTVQWLKRVVEYGCLDVEINHIVDSLNERERLILIGRYKIDRPLTLEALGRQLGITRERVRQIQDKVQKKLIARIKRATLLYSTAALHILRSQKDNVTLTTWTKQLVATGLLKDPRSLELLIAVARATKSSELALPEEFTQSLETNSQHVVCQGKSIVPSSEVKEMKCPECKSDIVPGGGLRPIHCDKPMHKAGTAWSGHTKVQRWRCNKCGKTTIINPAVNRDLMAGWTG